jgi:hypothetical protein
MLEARLARPRGEFKRARPQATGVRVEPQHEL